MHILSLFDESNNYISHFLFMRKSFITNLRKSTCLTWIHIIKTVSFPFILPINIFKTLITGRNGKISRAKRTGVLILKKTFSEFGNAIEYLERYSHKIVIFNSRILSITESKTKFSTKGRNISDPKRAITMKHIECVRRFLMHVLLQGSQKICYYGFLNNRMKFQNLKRNFPIQGYQKFKQRYAGLPMTELLKNVWDCDVRICPKCGSMPMQLLGKTDAPIL